MRYENVISRIGSKQWLSNNYIIEIEFNIKKNLGMDTKLCLGMATTVHQDWRTN